MSANLPTFVAAGEALTDLIVDADHPERWLSLTGGSTWNVARAMARLGVDTAFAGAISTDVFGQQLLLASRLAGLDLRFLQRVDRSPLLAVVHQLKPPSYFFIGDDSADLHFDAAQLPQGWEHQASWVHFGGISLAREPLAGKLVELATRLKAQGIRISFDPNFRALMDERYDATLERMVKLADVVKVSDEDLAGLFRTTDLAAAFKQLRAWQPQAIYLYTRGAYGASLHIDDRQWSEAALRVNVVDTVGAGDASIAALLYSLMRRSDLPPREHLRFALAGGAAACTTAGATPPSLHAIEQLLAA